MINISCSYTLPPLKTRTRTNNKTSLMSRIATHAGTWYSSSPEQLTKELTSYLQKANHKTKTPYPIPNAHICISPHAGYTYCGPTMAHSYGSLDFSKVTKPIRFLIMGPSHHFYFRNQIMLSSFKEIQTPVGNLSIDTKQVQSWLRTHPGIFSPMSGTDDEAEHSLEMQFPMLHTLLTYRGIDPSVVNIVPMLISSNDSETHKELSKILLDAYRDPEYDNYIIISSDFCHWGKRFQYTTYVNSMTDIENEEYVRLNSRSKMSHYDLKIWESISLLDKIGMDTLSLNNVIEWGNYLESSENTICGRNPLNLLLGMIEYSGDEKNFVWNWLDYSQSSHCEEVSDSSVSYASGCVCNK